MRNLIGAILACSLLAACASAGTKVSEEQANSFQEGQSTYEEVVGRLGRPTTNMTASNGKRIVVYSHVAVQAQPQNFIPIVGALSSSHDVQSNAVAFVFDARGVLLKKTYTHGDSTANVNLLSQ